MNITTSNISSTSRAPEQAALTSTASPGEEIAIVPQKRRVSSQFFKYQDIALRILDLLSQEDVKNLLRLNRTIQNQLMKIVTKQIQVFKRYTSLFSKAMRKNAMASWNPSLPLPPVATCFPLIAEASTFLKPQ